MNSPTLKKPNDYGWHDDSPTYSQSYLEPVVLSLLAKYDCGSVLDLGCGNGVMVRRLIESGLRRSWVRAGRGGTGDRSTKRRRCEDLPARGRRRSNFGG